LFSKELESWGADGIYLMPSLTDDPCEFDGVAFVKSGKLNHGIIRFHVRRFQNAFRVEFNDARLQILATFMDLRSLTLFLKKYLEDYDGPLCELILTESLTYSNLYIGSHASIVFDPDCPLAFKELIHMAQSF
jgi:hypothetical protein